MCNFEPEFYADKEETTDNFWFYKWSKIGFTQTVPPNIIRSAISLNYSGLF